MIYTFVIFNLSLNFKNTFNLNGLRKKYDLANHISSIAHVYCMDKQFERGDMSMAYKYSKGWYVMQLKNRGIRYHPVGRKKLELYKTWVVRNLYNELNSKE